MIFFVLKAYYMCVFYFLETCDTCQRIRKELNLPENVIEIDIKTQPLTTLQLELLKANSGSYEALFSKRAQLYSQRKLKEKNLTESDYKKLLLEHYTFLKRPILFCETNLFIGNTANVIAKAKAFLHE
jgi:arsenate reductase